MYKESLISIIVPVYSVNVDYLKQCILSIKMQTYERIEVIIICDGASEEIVNICKSITCDDNRFLVISRENRGVSYTRNEGILKAKGEWITFVDADDWLDKNACEIFANKIIKDNLNFDFVMMKNYINTESIQTEVINGFDSDCIIDKDVIFNMFQSTFGSKFGTHKYCESVWKNFYNKDFINKNKILFDENVKVGEDMLFNYKVWNKCNKGYYINNAIYHYRKNEESVMNSDYNKLIIKYDELYPKFEEVVKSLDNKYKENSELFAIRQLERFSLNFMFKKVSKYKEFKILVNKEYYRKNIKKANIKNLQLKHAIFLFLIKLKLYHSLELMCRIFNKNRRNKL